MRSFCLTIVLLLLTAGMAVSAPSFNGYTGLIVVPTADALGMDEFNLGAFSSDLEPRVETFEVQYGLRDNLEVGAARTRVVGDSHHTVLMGKYLFRAETAGQAGVAAGIFDPTDEIESTAYVVMSKTLSRTASVFDEEFTGVRGTIGFGGGLLQGVFLGASAGLGDRLLLMAELVKSDLDDGGNHKFNFGARLNVGGGIRLHGAFFDNFDDFGFGASYNKTLP